MRRRAIFLATNAKQGMQYDHPCCWKAQTNAIMLDVASTTVGDEKGCCQAEEEKPVILV